MTKRTPPPTGKKKVKRWGTDILFKQPKARKLKRVLILLDPKDRK